MCKKTHYNEEVTYKSIKKMKNKNIILNNKLNELSKSKFRKSFYLNEKDILYIKNKGIKEIIIHTYKFINARLKPKYIYNDGAQTPMKGHPVFKAQHATATCCRECLYKWHNINPNKELTDNEINYIVSIIILWIKKQLK